MTTFYSISPQTAHDTVEEMARQTGVIRSALADLEQTVQSRLAEWDDDARIEYNNTRAKWNAIAERMPVKLTSCGQTLQNIVTSYQQTERAGASGWSGQSGGMR